MDLLTVNSLFFWIISFMYVIKFCSQSALSVKHLMSAHECPLCTWSAACYWLNGYNILTEYYSFPIFIYKAYTKSSNNCNPLRIFYALRFLSCAAVVSPIFNRKNDNETCTICDYNFITGNVRFWSFPYICLLYTSRCV